MRCLTLSPSGRPCRGIPTDGTGHELTSSGPLILIAVAFDQGQSRTK
jgi:hypothetical protein